jgi:hypothetical protein
MTNGIPTDQAWERETVINFSEAEPDALSVWTASPRMGRKLEKLCKLQGIQPTRTTRPTWEAVLPISCLRLVGVRRKRILTDEQRAKLSERLAKMREGKKKP